MNIDICKSPFQLVGTRIKKFSLNNDFVILDAGLLPSLKVDAAYTIESIEKQDKCIVGIIVLNIKASLKDKDKNRISISLSVEGCFIVPLETQGFENMLGVNGCASLYSIARAYILSATSQSFSGSHILLPMINTFKLTQSDKPKT